MSNFKFGSENVGNDPNKKKIAEQVPFFSFNSSSDTNANFLQGKGNIDKDSSVAKTQTEFASGGDNSSSSKQPTFSFGSVSSSGVSLEGPKSTTVDKGFKLGDSSSFSFSSSSSSFSSSSSSISNEVKSDTSSSLNKKTTDSTGAAFEAGGFGFSGGGGGFGTISGGFSFGDAQVGKSGFSNIGEGKKEADVISNKAASSVPFSFSQITSGTSTSTIVASGRAEEAERQQKQALKETPALIGDSGGSLNNQKSQNAASSNNFSFNFGGDAKQQQEQQEQPSQQNFGGDSKQQQQQQEKSSQFSFGGDSKQQQSKQSTESGGKIEEVERLKKQAVKQLKDNSFEEIINQWNMQLEEDVSSFNRLANQAMKDDKLLLLNEKKIYNTATEVKQVANQLKQLKENLEIISDDQEDLEKQITDIEKKTNLLYDKMNPSNPDMERQQMYTMAEDINRQLDSITQSLNGMTKDLNSKYNEKIDPTNKINQIIQIMNSHLSALQWIESKLHK